MRRPEFKVKLDLAGLYGLDKGFPGSQSVWSLTAAQRALLLGPPKGEAANPKPKRILSMDEMKRRTAKTLEKQNAASGADG